MSNKVLVIAAHPDDETLGCGGTLLKHVDKGDQVAWIIVTSMSEKQGYTPDRIDERNDEIDQVSRELQIETVYRLNLPTAQLDTTLLKGAIEKITNVFVEFQPGTVYLPNRSDIHSDHRFTYNASIICTKTFRFPFIRKVLMYETLSETDFAPPLPENTFQANFFVDITSYFQHKCQVATLYASELHPHPFPRSLESIRALATLRGANAGVQYAEAFQILKMLD